MADPLLIPAYPAVLRAGLPVIVTRERGNGGEGRTFGAIWLGETDGERFIARAESVGRGIFSPGMEQLGTGASVGLDLRDPVVRDAVRGAIAERVPRTHVDRDEWIAMCRTGVAFHGGHGGYRHWVLHPWTSIDAVEFVPPGADHWSRERYDVMEIAALNTIDLDHPDQNDLALAAVADTVLS